MIISSIYKMFQKLLTLIAFVLMLFLFILKLQEYLTPPPLPAHKESLVSTGISDDALAAQANSVNINEFQKILKPILVERVVGTPGHETIKNYITNELRKLKWTVELDSFEDTTPDRRRLTFTNIIATYKPEAVKVLVFACHYDSKLSNYVFIGATDSAVPCAMLLYLARNLDDTLRKLQLTVGFQLIFFDGEEAFVNWSAKDSLYGARHLADLMEARTHDAVKNMNDLKRMSLFVLLDLIGASSPEFYSYFRNTNKWYSLLVSIEKRLLAKGFLQSDLNDGIYKYYFHDQAFYGAQIDDDHKPFLKKGVPVLHCIPYPFPDVWHTEYDNESIINYNTVNNLLKIFKVFIIQYLVSTSAG